MNHDPNRIYVCKRSELMAHQVRVVPLQRDAQGWPREAIVFLDPAGIGETTATGDTSESGGTVRVYVNQCQHIPVPLDGGSRDFFTTDFTHLRCGTHGAQYRLSDGLCTTGPCLGSSLEALDVIVEGDALYIRDLLDPPHATSD